MESPLSEFFESISALIITVLGITFIALLLSKYGKYDKTLIDRNDNKSTSHYTMAYSDFETSFSSSEVLSDIIASQDIAIVINGHEVSETMLKQAREHKEADIQAIKNMLTSERYKKTYSFDSLGALNGMIFTSE